MSDIWCQTMIGATMPDWSLNSLWNHPDAAVAIVTVTGAFLVGVVAVICYAWQQVNQANVDADLKRNMLDRGMSVDEIERVLKARSTPDASATKK